MNAGLPEDKFGYFLMYRIRITDLSVFPLLIIVNITLEDDNCKHKLHKYLQKWHILHKYLRCYCIILITVVY